MTVTFVTAPGERYPPNLTAGVERLRCLDIPLELQELLYVRLRSNSYGPARPFLPTFSVGMYSTKLYGTNTVLLLLDYTLEYVYLVHAQLYRSRVLVYRYGTVLQY